ncbi:hypothetical protein [Hyphomicrobium sp.]|uniref:hypothetical protein n=1 Tax=Hyphomicrobium sp. TaxID=82 RepID=UPI0025BE2B1E|nr:hypothetical protein [Hyphomicrobium sp.]MCC7251610.1 hypothetical protein [Hyphomicrobium sp.]
MNASANTMPLTAYIGIYSLVTDPLHLSPMAPSEDRWFANALRRLKRGFVHPVFYEEHVVCFIPIANGLKVTVSDYRRLFHLEFNIAETPDAITLPHWLDQAEGLASQAHTHHALAVLTAPGGELSEGRYRPSRRAAKRRPRSANAADAAASHGP